MRTTVHVSGRALAVLLAPVLVLAGALQPDPVLPGPQATAPVAQPAAVPRLPAPAPSAPRTAAPAAPVALRAGVPEPPRARRPADRTRKDRQAPARRTPEERGRAALEALPYDWRALGYRVVFRGPDGDTLGTANRRTRTITIHVRRTQSEQSLRATIAHELAHALDFSHGTQQRRADYRRLRGLPRPSRWFPCSGCDDLASPAGDFAEVFALWLAGPGDFRSRVKGPPDARELARLVPLFALPRASAAPSPAPSPATGGTEEQGDDGVLPPVLDPPPPGSRRLPV